MSPFLEIFNLHKSFQTPTGPNLIVEGFSITINEGEFVSLIGHSGCGKSTVLSMVAGLIQPSLGGIVLANREVLEAGPDRGVVFQSPNLLPWLTAYENIMLGVNQVFSHARAADRRDIAMHYLQKVGLGDSANRKPDEMSSGMKQRVGIARAFAIRPKVLLLDEPFGMLDQLTRFELQDVLMKLCASDKKTAIMVTHDVDEAVLLSDRIAMMTNGPRAKLGQTVSVPFERPRNRIELMELPEYYTIRAQVIDFLEQHDRHRQTEAVPA